MGPANPARYGLSYSVSLVESGIAVSSTSITTRQNIQYNWPKLRDVPDMLDALGEVGMHAIQTSGNTIRNVTSD
ncbi:MAG: hypothetical protein AAFY21_08845, partial [Cyanobacteria bacterium J06641_2]